MIDLSPRRAALGSLLGLTLMGMAAGPTLAQATGTHTGPVANHATSGKKGKKKGKGKGRPQVTVHCASVGVTCKGKPGPAGPAGPAGPTGPAGTPGTNGAIVLRARGAAAGVTLTGESGSCVSLLCGESIPVSPDIWTEGPEEDDQFLGTFTVTIPSESVCDIENSSKVLEEDRVIVTVLIDGKLEGIAELEGETSEVTLNTSIIFNLGIEAEEAAAEGFGEGFFMGNGTNQAHVLSVQGEDECEGSVHAKVSNMAIDVLGTV
jgi:hypothetical protein